jgi:hypothetical protein
LFFFILINAVYLPSFSYPFHFTKKYFKRKYFLNLKKNNPTLLALISTMPIVFFYFFVHTTSIIFSETSSPTQYLLLPRLYFLGTSTATSLFLPYIYSYSCAYIYPCLHTSTLLKLLPSSVFSLLLPISLLQLLFMPLCLRPLFFYPLPLPNPILTSV